MDDDAKVKLKTIGLAAIFVILFGIAVYFVLRKPESYRQEYSAYVVEKQARHLETDEGRLVKWILLVQDLNGERFHVNVSAQVFQQVQPGTFIEKKATDKEPYIGR